MFTFSYLSSVLLLYEFCPSYFLKGLVESLLDEVQQDQADVEPQVNDWDFNRSKRDIGMIASIVIRSARRVREEQERYLLRHTDSVLVGMLMELSSSPPFLSLSLVCLFYTCCISI